MKCGDCKKRNSKITFANSQLEYSHGFVVEICRKCYIKRLQDVNDANIIQIKSQEELIKLKA